MPANPIGALRLSSQRIHCPHPGSLLELLTHMGAMQAQDYAAVKYAVARRLAAQPSQAQIEALIASKQVLRMWSLRGTIHLLPAPDAAWITRLVSPRPLAAGNRLLQAEQLGPAKLDKSITVLQQALEGGHLLERNQLYARLEAAGLPTDAQRGYHLLAHAGLRGLLCMGPLSGRQPTFAWLADWVPNPIQLSEQEALAELARRYFRSHGPARVEDWIWWSGLSVKQGKGAHEMIRPELEHEVVDGTSYWMGGEPQRAKGFYLLPAFDEFIVGYQDRSMVVPPDLIGALMPYKNGLIQAVMVQDGQVLGTWKRTLNKDRLTFEVAPFATLNAQQARQLQEAAEGYAAYLGATLHKINGLR